MRKVLGALVGVFVLSACEMVPAHVEPRDVDDAMARELYKTVCKGLEMKDDDTRRYAAERMIEVPPEDSTECMCEYAWSAEKHTWDAAILEGLQSTERDDLVQCFLPALDDPAIEDKNGLVAALGRTRGESVLPKLKSLAADSGEEVEVRTTALRGLGGTKDAEAVQIMTKLLSDDGDETVRAAAASALVGQVDQPVVDALVVAVTDDESGVVRAAALKTVRGLNLPESDEMNCKAMLEDPSPDVRSQAILNYKGTKRDAAVACLRKKAFQVEEDPGVRSSLITVLKSSPNQGAADILCDAIPHYMKSYIEDSSPEKVPGTDICQAQNDRDWERSYECFEKALRSKGAWSCKGQQYVAAWFREVGGKPYVPRCKGDEVYGEVVFQ